MINCVTLVGNLVAKPVLKETKDHELATFTLAVNKDKETCFFFDCYAWDPVSGFIAKYLDKGSKVAIHGELIQQVYEDKNKDKKSSVRVLVRNVEFLSKIETK